VNTIWSDTTIDYDGSQLRAGWLTDTFGLALDAAAAFTGACDVSPEHMIDLEDLAARERIVSRGMLHFIVEHQDGDLERQVMRQRLLVTCALESLVACGVAGLRREGDDLFVLIDDPVDDRASGTPRKLSVSVATRSARGTGLTHLGLNVDPAGAPVPAIGLAELGLDPRPLAADLLRRYAAEIAGVRHALAKVREAP
jgi:hypothetical protein